jgi:hypothetical protein
MFGCKNYYEMSQGQSESLKMCRAGLDPENCSETCDGFQSITDCGTDRGIDTALISEGLLIALRLLMPALRDAAKKSENKFDDVLVGILEAIAK